jgi:hypothetical protein
MAWLAPFPGRLLEPMSNYGPRGMTVHDRTRLIGQLLYFFLDRLLLESTQNSALHNSYCSFTSPVFPASSKFDCIRREGTANVALTLPEMS